MSKLQDVNIAEIRARYPDVFNRPASARLATPAMLIAALAIFVYGLVDLEFSPSRFVSGLGQLGWISMMMMPPDPGSSLPLYLKALGETLSIALLGTTLAALLALPVSLFAARNIVPGIVAPGDAGDARRRAGHIRLWPGRSRFLAVALCRRAEPARLDQHDDDAARPRLVAAALSEGVG